MPDVVFAEVFSQAELALLLTQHNGNSKILAGLVLGRAA